MLMEINHNKEENNESSEYFVNFSIRDYVAEIRKKDPKKCWLFGSLGDPENSDHVFSSYYSSELTTCLLSPNDPRDLNSSDDTPEETQATNNRPRSSGIDNDEGKVIYDGSSGSTSMNNDQYRHKDGVNEGAKIGHNVAADNNKPERNRPRRKPRKFRLLADIYKDPASKLRASSDITNSPENVNRRFFTEIEDDQSSDDVTLSAFCRKQKAVEVTDSTLKKKRRTTRVESSRVDQDKKSKHEFKDSTRNDAKNETGVHLRKKLRTDDIGTQIMSKSKKDYVLPGRQEFNQTEATETTNEDYEMEVVMLLARHFKEENTSANEQIRELDTITACACACVEKKLHKNTAKNPVVNTHLKFTKEKLQKSFSSVQTIDHPKVTTATVFQAHKEIHSKKASGVMHVVQTREALVCSVNRNPADFNIPNAENKFMRGG